MGQISVSIVSENTLTYEGLLRVLDHKDIEIFPSAKDLTGTSALKPDVIMLSSFVFLQMENIGNGFFVERFPFSRFICFYIGDLHEQFELHLLMAGVKGVIYKSDPADTFLKAVKKVYGGKYWAEKVTLKKFYNLRDRKNEGDNLSNPGRLLTPREVEIMSFLSKGHQNKTISAKLFISERTVKYHIYNIFKKLKVTNRIEAVNSFKSGHENVRHL